MPKLALCNIFPDYKKLKTFAMANGFSGIDWSFEIENLPKSPHQISSWVYEQSFLKPLETRYHCPFFQVDLGHSNPAETKKAIDIFQHIIHLVSKAAGRYLTIHIGLGHDSTESLSWEKTIENLRNIVTYGAEHDVRICLENLAWGWTSKPNLFEKLIRKSGAGVTLDIGHAYVCESVRSRQFEVADFIAPHDGNVVNAHIYHTEVEGLGHLPPKQLSDIRQRLKILQNAGCEWWNIEIKEPDKLLFTKKIIDRYLTEENTVNHVVAAG